MNLIPCFHCAKKIALQQKVSFREECPHCQSDLHVCLNCQFYDESAHNECREVSAENVKNKERNNYCEYFSPSSKTKEESQSLKREEQIRIAEALFKKNS